MILCDTGPLVAVLDPRQGEIHERCVSFLRGLSEGLVTTWPCLTEAMYLAYKIGGFPLQEALARLIASDVFEIQHLEKTSVARIETLMRRYTNVPMDFADAALFVSAELRGIRRIFTLDNDFRIYRFDDGGYFDVVPES